jgi:hypothetical protein
VADIRPIERDDLDGVAELVRAGLPGWSRSPEILARTLLDDPWTPDPPRSLVAVDESGALVGTIGAQRRKLRFDGEVLDAVAVSHLVVAPGGRTAATGAMLVKALLAGDQALTITDSSTPEVTRIWRLFGGELDTARGYQYMLVLSTRRWLGGLARALVTRQKVTRRDVPVESLPLHAAGSRVGSRANPEPTPELSSADASPAEIAEFGSTLERKVRARIAHDPEYLAARFAQLEAMDIGGSVVHRIVRRAGRPIGWFAYIARPRVSRILCVSADADNTDAVLEALLDDARERGTGVLAGRSAPHLIEPLHRRMAVLGAIRAPLVHCADPELRSVIASSASLLTEFELLDSEWW